MDKKYNFQESESAIKKMWAEKQVYKFDYTRGPLFSIDTPPPTVSGALHIGHMFSYTHTDIIARFKRLSGDAVFYPFGFDDNGLPTERFVEKKCKVRPHTMPRSEFINLCLEQTVEVEEQFKNLWQQMGISADWNYCYTTISPLARKISQESFLRLFNKEYIYRQYEPALYCPTCRTSVAQAELDDIEKTSLFSDIQFTTTEGEAIVISTTRPELLSSCVAIFYHPEDSRFKKLAGKKARVPLFKFEVPILEDDLVDPEKGTGLVMCCTFGDKNDVQWFKKHNLPYKQSVGPDGKWVEETGILAGLKAEDARAKILEELKNLNVVLEQKPTTRAVNVHERCKKEIEYIALSQWFLKILPYKKELVKQADKIEWNPAHMKQRYVNWVENIGWDWCLSRQRFYGIPFPVWYCSNGHILLANVDQLPIDPQETAYKGPCPECGDTTITPEKDVMDTWNTSSLTPQICFALFDHDKHSAFDADAVKKFIPMSMRPQAHDIIRTWAFYTITKSWMHYDDLPWKSIVISGHVLSDQKEKISKSQGNTPLDPHKLLEQYSADVIRYWTASGRLGQDVAFSPTQLKIGQRLVTKIWNAFRFVQEHIEGVPRQAPEHLGAVNEWLAHQSSLCFASYQKHLNEYEFSLALDAVEKFFWHDFCDNYLEIVKDQLFNPDNYTHEEVQATKWTLNTIGLRILQYYAPYLPYITEQLFQALYAKHMQEASVHITHYSKTVFEFPKSASAMNHAIKAIAEIRKLKTEKQLSLKVPIDEVTFYANEEAILKQLKSLEQIIKGVTHAQKIIYTQDKNETSLVEEDNQWKATIALTL
jgi:valyl-tRNA synthetase